MSAKESQNFIPINQPNVDFALSTPEPSRSNFDETQQHYSSIDKEPLESQYMHSQQDLQNLQNRANYVQQKNGQNGSFSNSLYQKQRNRQYQNKQGRLSNNTPHKTHRDFNQQNNNNIYTYHQNYHGGYNNQFHHQVCITFFFLLEFKTNQTKRKSTIIPINTCKFSSQKTPKSIRKY